MPSFLDNDQSCNSHLAGLVAINIVTQVLDEAEDILNAAHDSGQPWRYIWCQKKGHGEFYENDKFLGILDVKVDENNANNNEIIQNDNVIVTSTPQKEIDYIPRTYNENSLIGQGDEEIQMRNTDLHSPSMLINCLFDMSDVEHSESMENFDDVQVNPEPRDLLANTVAKLVESYVNLALNTACGEAIIPEPQVLAASIKGSSNSSYSLLTDALVTDDTDNDNASNNTEQEKSNEDKDQSTTKMVNDEYLEEITKNDIDEYENTFLTLNRDYDKYSEEEEDFVAEEKTLTMQDVELTANKSSENLESFADSTYQISTKLEETCCTHGQAVEGNKNSLVKRCRLQGAKLMSRLRSWWWKQRLIGKRKGTRSGICPISPKARNLAASLLDHRKLRSPSPTRTAAWKFNTVNEALIHSYNMKEYDFEINSSDTVEKH